MAVALAFVMPHIHVGTDISTNRAIEMVIAVGAGTVTFIGVVFSLLFVVVQFGSTTFSPRLTLFRDAPIVWRAFAFYTTVVVYSFTAALDDLTAIAPPNRRSALESRRRRVHDPDGRRPRIGAAAGEAKSFA